jgi:hypothetical protein
MPPELIALLQRHAELGRLLPQGDEISHAIAFEDAAKRAEIKLVIAEMERVLAEIRALIAAAAKTLKN